VHAHTADIDDVVATIEPGGAAIQDAGGYLTPLARFTSTTLDG